MTGIAVGSSLLGGAAFGWPLAIFVAIATGALLATARERGTTLVPGAVLVAAAAFGAWRGVPPPDVRAPPWTDAVAAVRGHVASAPTASGRTQQFAIAVEAVAVEDGWIDASGRGCVVAPAFPYLGLADRVRLSGLVRPIQDQPAGVRAYLRSRRCGATMFAGSATIEATGAGWQRQIAAARRAVSEKLQRAAPGDAGALLSGLVTGDDHALSSSRQEAFLRTGTTHVTAVSGSNLALLLVILTALGRAAGWRRWLAWQLSTAGAIWGYAILVGLEAPALRAALVATGAVFAARFGRRPDFLTLIVVAAGLMVAVSPEQIWRLSFQLSLASSVALAATLSGMTLTGLPGWAEAGLVGSVAAQLATLPVTLPAFDSISLVSLPANLLIGPLIGVAFPTAALAGVVLFVWAPLGEALVLPARLAADGVLAVIDAVGGAGAGVLTTGVSSSIARWLVAALVAAAITALSRDGRTWAARLPDAVREASPGTRLAAAALLIGTTVGIVVRVIG